MIGFPFDSHVFFDEDGIPVYDRAITSAPYRAILKNVFSTGVLALDNCFKTTANGNMSVTVSSGFAMVEGLMKLEENDLVLQIPNADAYDRIDSIVLRLDDNDAVRACEFYVLKGTPAVEPAQPTLTREGSVYEIAVANILVPYGCTQITEANIIDTRKNVDRCGYINTANSFEQIIEDVQAHMNNEVIHITSDERQKWNDGVKEDGDVSGSLRNITVSTTDITAGTTELATGQFYVVYEEE